MDLLPELAYRWPGGIAADLTQDAESQYRQLLAALAAHRLVRECHTCASSCFFAAFAHLCWDQESLVVLANHTAADTWHGRIARIRCL